MDNTQRIGIDIEGVIRTKGKKARSVEEYLDAKPISDAITVIAGLADKLGPENIFIISRCPEYAEDVILQWLDNQNFFSDIGFNRSNVYFCRERVDKALIARRLQLTHFIDNRIDVLDAMLDVVANRILFTGGSNHDKTEIDDSIIVLNNWNSILEYIKKYV